MQHTPPARKTRSQARAQYVHTPTPRAALDGTPAVPQLRVQLDRGPCREGAAPSRKEGKGPRRSRSFSGVENSVEEEGSDGTEGVPAPVGASQGTGGPTLSQSDQPVSHWSEPSLLAIMQQMTQIMANFHEASVSESSRPPAFKTPSMMAPEFFDGPQPSKVRSFIQSCKLIFHNDLANFSKDRKKALYATSFLICRAEKWIEPYLSNLTNEDPNYLLNSWDLFESQLFTLFVDPNEFRKAEAELDSLRMKEGGHVSLYIANFRSLVSRIGDWGERALIHHFRKGLASRILEQLASHPSRIDFLQDLMDVTLELDTRYNERQKEKSRHQERKPEASKSNSFHPQNSSSSSQKKRKNFQRRDKPHSSLLNKNFKLMNSEKERRIKEDLCTYCGGKNSLESCFKRPQNNITQLIPIDSGANNSFIAKQFVHKYSLSTSELLEKIPLIILYSSESPSLFVTHHTKYMVELPSFQSFEWDFLVIDTPKGEDLILGFEFLNHSNPSIDLRKGLITLNSDPSKSFSNAFSSTKSCAALVGGSRTPSFPSSVHIPSLNSHRSLLSSRDEVFNKLKDLGEDNFVPSLHLFFGNMDLPPSSYHDALEEWWDEEEEPEEVETVKAEKIVPHHAGDHNIELEGSLPPVGVTYSLSNQESDTLRAYISENVKNGFICPSSFSTGAPVLFVKKKDGGLCLCVDYRKLNAVTRKNKYPVPPMNQILNVFNGSSIFSKIDLHGAYNLLRIKEVDEHLTAFRTKYGSYEYLVMPFGLTNAPASFRKLVNNIFQDLLDYVVVYLDDIMVFSKSEEEHVTHVSTVLSRLRANNLFAKASKCLFHFSSVEYLGYIVSSEGLKMDQAEVQQILNWPPPRNLKALQSFLGLANFYCQSNASNHALGAVLSQVSDSGKNRIAFDSCKLIPEELKYEIHDKELLGIVWALKCLRAFLLSLSLSFKALTNHYSFQYFMSSKVLPHCQTCWAEFLSEFHFSVTYFPGRLATLPDALSCWDNIYLERREDFISMNPMNLQQLIKQDEVQPSRYFAVNVESFSNLIDSIQKALW
ncbi:hypothetical protein O181_032832 [Austropuccinia psidii MF-1]|uniref:RNA-directed DNA polymerase n=1 Tax=Austropuccinia psidii MF-1 TaxID=1389203 RepID=A0A9Q3D080_9BASI|nr:hypothetical protein [Austropuccinia psidii MF-1]